MIFFEVGDKVEAKLSDSPDGWSTATILEVDRYDPRMPYLVCFEGEPDSVWVYTQDARSKGTSTAERLVKSLTEEERHEVMDILVSLEEEEEVVPPKPKFKVGDIVRAGPQYGERFYRFDEGSYGVVVEENSHRYPESVDPLSVTVSWECPQGHIRRQHCPEKALIKVGHSSYTVAMDTRLPR